MSDSIIAPPTETSVGNYFIANYPPFSSWKPEYITKFLHALSLPPKPGPIGLYVHLPFCRQRCHYCYFRVYPRRTTEDIELYIDSVVNELAIYQKYPALEGRSFNSVYFGGGSPSYLSPEQIRSLLGGLQKISPWENVEECTFECEPGTVTREKLRTLKELGVTRLSLGFQTLNNAILRRSGRDVVVEDCYRAFLQAREAGFDEINIDLLAGLQGETRDTWRYTIDRVLELDPDCVTIYQLELTHNSHLFKSMNAGRKVALPSWPNKRELVRESFETLERAGYTIGSGYMAIKNPAKWRFVYTVEHFWHGTDLLALGETAFGMIRGVHYQNKDTFEAYTSAVAQDWLPLRRAFQMSPSQRMRRELILLFKTGALDAAYFRKKYKVELLDVFEGEFQSLLENGFVEVDGDRIRLTREGLLQVDWLLPKFYEPEYVGVRYT
jgi:oxygen-independent coproporphyrinogen III oxidase